MQAFEFCSGDFHWPHCKARSLAGPVTFLIIKLSVSDLLRAAPGPFVSLLRYRTEKYIKINQDCPSAVTWKGRLLFILPGQQSRSVMLLYLKMSLNMFSNISEQIISVNVKEQKSETCQTVVFNHHTPWSYSIISTVFLNFILEVAQLFISDSTSHVQPCDLQHMNCDPADVQQKYNFHHNKQMQFLLQSAVW